MRYFSVFTGVGGFEIAMPDEWISIGFSEIDKHANDVLRYRFPEVKNYGDIEKISYEELPDFDVLVGGSPCQDVSVAGKRAGINGLRSGLFFSYVALLKVKKPRYFIFENVKGLLSSNEGRDFADVIDQFSEAGYDIWWQVLDAPWFGIPQHRERVLIIGTLGKTGFQKVFFEPRCSRPHLGIKTMRQITENAIPVASRTRCNNGTNHQKLEFRTDGMANALTSVQKGSMVALINEDADAPTDKWIRYFTPLECERLMGWPDEYTRYGINDDGARYELSNNTRYRLIANGVVPSVVRTIIDQIMVVVQ